MYDMTGIKLIMSIHIGFTRLIQKRHRLRVNIIRVAPPSEKMRNFVFTLYTWFMLLKVNFVNMCQKICLCEVQFHSKLW